MNNFQVIILVMLVNLTLYCHGYSSNSESVIEIDSKNTDLESIQKEENISIEAGQFFKTVQLGILDKVTGRVLQKALTLDKPIQFGTLIIEVKRCWHDSSSIHPETKTFLIIQNKSFDGKLTPAFKGWMFASTPSIATLEHPVYDVWVIGVDQASRTNEKVLPTLSINENLFKGRSHDQRDRQLEKILKSVRS